MQGVQVLSLVGELRFHMLCSMAKKKKKSNYTPVKNVKKKKKKKNITQWKNFTWDYFLVSFKKHSQAQKT